MTDTMTLHTSVEKENAGYFIHPKKFLLWLIIVASVMLFAAFTSAYIVRRGEGNWLIFDLPPMFAFTTAIIILGSITMQLAYFFAKKDELNRVKIFTALTLFFAIVFATGQWIGWVQLTNMQVHFVGNPAESFVYVISGLHLLHVIAAIFFLLFIFIQSMQLKIHKKNLITINLCTTFWHFIGALWVYLYFFLLLNR